MRKTVSMLIPLLLAAFVPAGPAGASACAGGPVNDCVADALEWRAEPRSFSNVGATMEPNEPASCGEPATPIHASVWLRLEVRAPGAADGFVVHLDAPFLATAAAYTRAADGTLAQVACGVSDTDAGLRSPQFFLPCAAGATYYVQVGGQSPSETGAFSIWESGYTRFNLTPSDPCPFKPSLPGMTYVSSVTPGHGEIELTWSAPYLTGGRGVPLSHYSVYRAASCGGPFALLANVTSRWVSDAGLPDGATYCYRVAAVNEVGEGPASSPRAATTWSAPRAPRGLVVAPAGDGELRLTWLASPDQAGPAPMLEHRVYRAPSASGPFTLLATANASATTHTDAGLARGETWHYRVAVVNPVGESAPSAPASNATWAVPGAPRDVRADIILFPAGHRVSWSAPAEPAPFTHYRVYRAASAEGAAVLVAEVPRGVTSVTDPARGLLVAAHYEVRATNPAGEGAASPRACSVYPIEAPLARCA